MSAQSGHPLNLAALSSAHLLGMKNGAGGMKCADNKSGFPTEGMFIIMARPLFKKNHFVKPCGKKYAYEK